MSLTPEIRRWRELADGWSAAAERMTTLTVEVSAGLLARLDIEPTERVLDVACGAGDPALRLAELSATVVACDGSPQMLEALLARRSRSTPWAVAAAGERLPFRPESFDVLSCRFGAMFVDAPVTTLAHWRQLLRPGGRAVLAVWGPLANNPYFTLVSDALGELGNEPAPLSDDLHSPFEWAEPGSLAAVLRESGFVAVREELTTCLLRLDEVRPEGFLDFQLELSLTVRERCAGLGAAQLAELRRDTTERAAAWATDAGLVVPACVNYVSGVRPAEVAG